MPRKQAIPGSSSNYCICWSHMCPSLNAGCNQETQVYRLESVVYQRRRTKHSQTMPNYLCLLYGLRRQTDLPKFWICLPLCGSFPQLRMQLMRNWIYHCPHSGWARRGLPSRWECSRYQVLSLGPAIFKFKLKNVLLNVSWCKRPYELVGFSVDQCFTMIPHHCLFLLFPATRLRSPICWDTFILSMSIIFFLEDESLYGAVASWILLLSLHVLRCDAWWFETVSSLASGWKGYTGWELLFLPDHVPFRARACKIELFFSRCPRTHPFQLLNSRVR